MRKHARVVVVGGGMMGVGLAYHLAEESWSDVLLVEKGELTSCSTWHAAGQCPSFIADFNMAKVHHYSNTLYPKLEAMTGQYTGWHGCGGIRLATTRDEVDWFRYVQGFSYLIGFRMEVIGPNEIKRYNPFLDTNGVLAGALTLDDGHVDPATCCTALAAAARRLGAEIMVHNRVIGIERSPSGEWLVKSEQGDVTCEHLVNAAGCYANEVMKWVGSSAPTINMEHQYLITDAIQEFKEWDGELPVMRDPYTARYYRQEQKSGLTGIYEDCAKESWTHQGGIPTWDSESELFE